MLGLLGGGLMMSLIVGLSLYLSYQEADRVDEEMRHRAEAIQLRLGPMLESVAENIQRAGQRWLQVREHSDGLWAAAVQRQLQEHPSLRGLWVLDREGQPMRGDGILHKGSLQSLQGAIREGRPAMVRSDEGIFMSRPIHNDQGVLTAFVLAELRLDALEDLLQRRGVLKDYRISLLASGQELIRMGPRLDASMNRWKVRIGGEVQSMPLQVELTPARREVVLPGWRGSHTVLGIGMLFSLMGGVLVFFAHRARMETRAAWEAAQAKGDFLAAMSHEIRTPMSSVMGMAEMLLDSPLEERQRGCVELIQASSLNLLEIVNQILDFSKVEAGKVELEQVGFRPSEVAEDAARLLARKAAEKGLELACIIPADARGERIGDPVRLRQVLINLLNNAIKFTSSGRVLLRLENRGGRFDDTPGRMVFSVEDSGIGIPHDRLDILFEPFTQVDASTTRTHGGTGLGLAICQRLVQLMGGQALGVESHPGRGSRFFFEIPMAFPVSLFDLDPDRDRSSRLGCVRRVLALTRGLGMAGSLRELTRWTGQRLKIYPDGDALFQALEKVSVPDRQRCLVLFEVSGNSFWKLQRWNRQLVDWGVPCAYLTQLGEGLEVEGGQRLDLPLRGGEWLALLEGGGARNVAPFPSSGSGTQPALEVLVAEDNPVNAQVLLHFLKRMGHHARWVTHGEEALEALKESPCDLVFMDMQMPRMDGMEAVRHLRAGAAGERNRRVPVIALTANALPRDHVRCLESGMDDILVKPLKPLALERRVQFWAGAERKVLLSETEVWDRRAFVQYLHGDRELLQGIVRMTLEDMPPQLEALREAVMVGDLGNVHRIAHAIRGMAAHLFSPALRRSAHALEEASDPIEVPRICHHLQSIWQRLQSSLKSVASSGAV